MTNEEDSRISRSPDVTETPSARGQQFETHRERELGRNGRTPVGTIISIVVVGIIAIIALYVALTNRNDQSENFPPTMPATQPPAGQSRVAQNQMTQSRPPQSVAEGQGELSRSAPAPTNAPQAADEAMPNDVLQARVEAVLYRSKQLDTADIAVTVSNGTVRLTGTVDTDRLKKYAETLVRQIKGVRRIENQIVVTGG